MAARLSSLRPRLRRCRRAGESRPRRAQQQLRDFADTLAGSRDLRELLDNPSIDTAQKLKVLDAIASRIGMFPQVRNFIAVIMDHGRLDESARDSREYRRIADEHSGLRRRRSPARAR